MATTSIGRITAGITTALVSGLIVLGLPSASHAAPANSQSAVSQTRPRLARFGQSGDHVRALQQALMSKGFTLVGGADGVFSPRTRAALRNFQSVVGFRPTGRLDRKTARLLGLTDAPVVAAAPVSAQAPAPAVAPAQPAPAAIAWSVGMLPVFGARGETVSAVQNALIAAGVQVFGGADGVFGNATRTALRSFQTTRGLQARGTLDEATAIELGLLPRPSAPAPATPAPTVAPAQPAPAAIAWSVGMLPVFGARGETVSAVQNALIAAGVQVFGGADGVFGNATRTALRSFQTTRGLQARGTLDEATAIELGLLPRPTLAVSISVFPVRPACFFADTWMAPRGENRKHEGVDIIANRGQDVFAVADGTITRVYTADTAKLSGNALRLTQADGTYFFYAHLDTFAPGVGLGSKVTAGQVIGTVGSTGATTPHLHFEVHPLGGAAVNPYPIVKAVNACRN